MREISRRLVDASIADRAEIACIGRERADLVVAGCAILESIIDLWTAARVGVADRGIREGILRKIGRAHVRNPVTNAQLVYLLLPDNKTNHRPYKLHYTLLCTKN